MTPEQENRLLQVENLLAQLVKSDHYSLEKNLQFNDGRNIQTGLTTGTVIGTVGGASGQKVGFFGAAPVVQHTPIGVANNFVAGGGTTVTHTSTFDGFFGTTTYTIGDLVYALKLLGLIKK